MNRLQEKYNNEIVPAMIEKFGYTYRLKCSYYVYSNGYYDNIDATTANFVYK